MGDYCLLAGRLPHPPTISKHPTPPPPSMEPAVVKGVTSSSSPLRPQTHSGSSLACILIDVTPCKGVMVFYCCFLSVSALVGCSKILLYLIVILCCCVLLYCTAVVGSTVFLSLAILCIAIIGGVLSHEDGKTQSDGSGFKPTTSEYIYSPVYNSLMFWLLLVSLFTYVWRLFKGGVYLKAESILVYHISHVKEHATCAVIHCYHTGKGGRDTSVMVADFSRW